METKRDLSGLMGPNAAVILDQLKDEFQVQCDGLVEDIDDTNIKARVSSLAKEAAPVYIQYAQCLREGIDIPPVVTNLIDTYEAELAQYEAIVALKAGERFKAFAKIALEIVATALIAGALKAATGGIL